MNVLAFVTDWALRCAVLVLFTGAALWALRARVVCTRLAAWKAALVAGMAMPLMLSLMPPLFHAPVPVQAVALPPVVLKAQAGVAAPREIDCIALAGALYVMVAFAMLLRLAVGTALARRLVRRAQLTAMPDVLESAEIRVPVTLGLLRPRVVLPPGWQSWDEATLTAVLTHERSHIARGDTQFQFLSALQRSLLWFSPLSWWLHSTLASLAEDASDDAAVATSGDAAHYAEMLLTFVHRAPARVLWHGVAMARTSQAERRIDRILSGHVLSSSLGRRALSVILGCAVAGSMLVAAAQVAPPPPPPAPRAPVAKSPTAPPPPAPAVPSKPSPVPPPPDTELAEPPEAPVPTPPPDSPDQIEDDAGRTLIQAIIDGKVQGRIQRQLAEVNERLQALRNLKQMVRTADIATAAQLAEMVAARSEMEAKMQAKQMEIERLRRQLGELDAALERAASAKKQ